MKKNILIINGPNLNMTGLREPAVYGKETLEDINEFIKAKLAKEDAALEFFQSNHEGGIIDKIQSVKDSADGIVLNAGAFTHYSYAIRDCISSVTKPVIETHISNVFAREAFRAESVIAPVCAGTVCGFGKNSYVLAVLGLLDIIG